VFVCLTESVNTVRSLIKLNATVTSRLPAGTKGLTAKRYMALQIRVSISQEKQ
jgi:hypothetical protein